MSVKPTQIPILEKFISVQGEGRNLGVPYYFLRTAGCPLRCNFCDTERSWKSDKSQLVDVDTIAIQTATEALDHGIEWMSITGGEPLLYPKQIMRIIEIWDDLSKNTLRVHIETSGRIYNEEVHMACDLYSPDAKTPCTGEQMSGFFKGINLIRSCDQIKCLISTAEDLDYAYRLNEEIAGVCPIILQPFNMNILTDSVKNMDESVRDTRTTEEIDIARLRRSLCVSYAWLVGALKQRMQQGQRWRNVQISPQMHVLAYGNVPLT